MDYKKKYLKYKKKYLQLKIINQIGGKEKKTSLKNNKIKNCSLKIINKSKLLIDKKLYILDSKSFQSTISSIGGIIDIRPYKDIKKEMNKINNNIGNSSLAYMYTEINLCSKYNMSLCFGLYGAMKIVKQLLYNIDSPVEIFPFNINIVKGKPYILGDYHYNPNISLGNFQIKNFKDSISKNKRVILADTTKCIQIYTSSKIKNIHINTNI
jgi:hypothetical protein